MKCKFCNKKMELKKITCGTHNYKLWISKCKCQEKEWDKEKKVKIINNSGIHEDPIDIIKNGFNKDYLLNIVKFYINKLDIMIQNNVGLFLVGPAGIGKTVSIVYTIFNILDQKLKTVRYINAVELSKLFKSFDKSDQKRYYSYLNTPIVFVDDIGFQDWNMYHFIDFRSNNKYITFYASNKTLDYLESTLTNPVMSRLQYKCIVEEIENVESHRELNLRR